MDLPPSFFTPTSAALRRFVVLFFATFILFGPARPSSTAAEPAKKSIDVPADTAERSFKALSAQSGVEVVYATGVVEGIRTNAVKGDYEALDAARLMLAGTGLSATQDEASGALMINRGAAQPAKKTTPPAGPPAAAGGGSEGSMSSNRSGTSGDEVVELSPFVVSEDDNVGYSANSTLAGTRINTPLRDVGASISVITPEFLRDTGATDVGELLSFTTGTEVGGVYGNFAGGGQSSGRPDQSGARENPQDNQRIRGIGSATTTRNFFITDIPFDSYNTSRVTISRGPNSLLFGVGNPAGVIEASLIRPQLDRNRNEAAIRYGSHDSHRETLDINRVLVKDRLALRVAALNEKSNFKQKPAFERERRLYATLEAVLREGKNSSFLGQTSLRASGETGKSHGTPVNVIPPLHGYSIFFQPPDPALDGMPGVSIDPRLLPGDPAYIYEPRATVDNRLATTAIPQNFGGYYGPPYFIQIPLIYDTPGQSAPGYASANNPALDGIAGMMGRIRYTPNGNGRGPIDVFTTRAAYRLLSGFVTPSLQNREVFDYRKRLISGSTNQIDKDFDAVNVALTQEFLEGRAGLELAYDHQKLRSKRALPFSFGENGAENGQSDIYIDVSEYLTNDEPNPNLGRPFILQLGRQDREQAHRREAFRATAFYRLDLEKEGRTFFGVPLGNHTLTGLFSTQEADSRSESYQIGWASDTRDLQTDVFQNALGAFRNQPVVIQYVGPSALSAASADDVRVTDVFSGRIPEDGDRHTVTFFDFTNRRLATEELYIRRFLNGGSLSRQKLESKSLSLKSDFFADTLISVIGWRWDSLQTFSNENNTRLSDGTLDPNFRLSDEIDLDEDVSSFTWSLVGRYPEALLGQLPFGMDLSAYYNQSENFNPVRVRTNLNGAIIEAPAGETKEYGILAEFLERRVSLRLNWFKTLQSNSSNDAQGATGGIYNFPSYLTTRFRQAETEGIAFEDVPGAAAAGYHSYRQMYETLFQLLPEPTNTLKNFRFDENGDIRSDGLQGLTDTSDLTARGFEAELVGNITNRWRVSANVAKQETVLNDSARLTSEVAQAVYANLVKFNLLGVENAPALPVRETVAERYASQLSAPLTNTVARDGAVAQEQRRWRANIVTTYDFRDVDIPVLNRMSIGTAVRWQSKIALGNPFLTGERLKEKIVETTPGYNSASEIANDDPIMETQFPDLANPIYGSKELAGDFWISYRTMIFDDIEWRLQLNVRNAWGNGDDIPVTANPDGRIAIIRIPNETRWFLTSTFSF